MTKNRYYTVMKHTILSKKELDILEKIISNFGNIAYFDAIKKLLDKDYSYDELRKQISLLSKRGWLVRIKRGVFAVASLESHNFSNISPLVISQVLIPNSYVSFEFALNHYGLFDQLPRKVTAVTAKKTKKYTFQDLEYRFVKTKPELIFGFKKLSLDNQKAKVAELEKTILDFLYFRNDTYTMDLVLEKLKTNKSEFDFEKLIAYALKYPITVRRRLGFLLDISGIDTKELVKKVNKSKGYSKLTKNSNKFNAKWRLYYENRFTK